VVTHDGSIIDTAKVFLELGVTDASLVDASKAHGLAMEDPGTDIDGTFTVFGSTNNFNNLQGTYGLDKVDNNNGAEFGFAGDANITGGKVADHIWDTGGTETSNVNNIHTKVFVDQFLLNTDDTFAFGITFSSGDFENNLGAGPKVATINGFTPGFNGGTNTSWVDFNVNSWGDGGTFSAGGTYHGLVNADAALVSGTSHFAAVSIINGSNSDFASGTDVVAYALGTFANAGALATAMASAGGAIDFAGTLVVGDAYDILVAYQKTGGGTGIADFQFRATDTHLTTATTFTGKDLVKLTGVALTQVESVLLGSNDVIHFNGHFSI